jgi:hypothetical protein
MIKIFYILSTLLCFSTLGASTFDKSYTLNGITFHVLCSNQSSINVLKIIPSGLEIDNSIIEKEIDGIVVDAEVADMNHDDSPEIYVFVSCVGSGTYGEVVAFSANHKKSLSSIYLLPAQEKDMLGYMGHDNFKIKDNRLLRIFPTYKKTDTNAHPTGLQKCLRYELLKGEASWVLKQVL